MPQMEATSKPKEKEKDTNVCRDFLNNICNRGTRCKFYHPPQQENHRKEQYSFCIDFQNQGCFRDSCRFIHANREDVELYQRTGDITTNLAHAIYNELRCDTINGIPVCKEFLNTGVCERELRCRYWHVALNDRRGRRGYDDGYTQSRSLGLKRRGGLPDYDYDMTKRPYGVYPTHGPADPTGYATQSHITELERRNAELITEVESLKRELSREKERYEDLLVLFRQTTGVNGYPRPNVNVGTVVPSWGQTSLQGDFYFGLA